MVFRNKDPVTPGSPALAAHTDQSQPALKNTTPAIPMPAEQFLPLAIKASDLLAEYHSRHGFHGHINKRSMVFDAKQMEVRLLDPRSIPPAGDLLESLISISPEQSGRTKGLADLRSDLYSLGTVFFEMLSGEPVFAARDPLELIHSHIARPPRSLQALVRSIPRPVGNIILKLLAKNADDRYQSASGLKFDLEKCRLLFMEHAIWEDFALGESDFPSSLMIPQKLYGRSREVDILQKACARVCSGFSEVIMVSGYAGVGKTVLAHEIGRMALLKGGFYIEGKFEQLRRDVPYSAIIQAFRELVRQLLMGGSDACASWRSELMQALGANARIIADVIPEIELILGETEDVAELEAQESFYRLSLTFQRFVQVFAKREVPLFVFIDDLQFADPASFRLLERLFSNEHNQFLCFIGAYRDNEIAEYHPLHSMIATLEKQRVVIRNISLEPLNLDDIKQMLSDMLDCPQPDCAPLAALIIEKTLGNPFFVHQFIRYMHTQRHLRYIAEDHRWIWDLEAIRKEASTDNVIDLLIGKIQRLDPDLQEMLMQASCMGMSFDTDFLSRVCMSDREKVELLVMQAVNEGLLMEIPSVYELGIVGLESTTYRFLHDRVQEALQAIIEPGQAQAIHLTIGRLMLEESQPDSLDDRIFSIVDHLNRGLPLLNELDGRIQLARLNVQAGRKAKASAAFSQAVSYLQTGAGIVPEGIWMQDYRLAFALYRDLSECQYLTGNHEEAERLFDLLLTNSRDHIDRAEIYNMRIVLYAKIGKFVESRQIGIEALGLFGHHFPALNDQDSLKQAFDLELERFHSLLNGRAVMDLLNLPPTEDPVCQICVKIAMNTIVSAYVSNPDLVHLLAIIATDLILESGYTPEAGYTFATAGVVFGSRLKDYATEYDFGQLALHYQKRTVNASTSCNVPYTLGVFISHWKKPLEASVSLLYEAFQAGLEVGDYVYGSLAATALPRVLLACDRDPLPAVLAETEKTISFFGQIKNYPSLERQKAMKSIVLNLQGRTSSLSSFDTDDFSEEEHVARMEAVQYRTGMAMYYFYKMYSLYIYEYFEEALGYAKLAGKYIPYIGNTLHEPDCIFYQSLCWCAAYADLTVDEQTSAWEDLLANQEKMRHWAELCPENYEGKYMLIEAEMARLFGETEQAERYYEHAVRVNEDRRALHDLALTYELLADFYLQRNLKRFADRYIAEAIKGYSAWGAHGKARQLGEKYPNARSLETARPDLDPISQLDVLTVVRATQAISQEIMLSSLIKTMMQMVLEHAGAEKGCLLLGSDGRLEIKAVARIEGDIIVVEQKEGCIIDDYVPAAVVNLVWKTGERVVLDDASQPNMFSSDPYFSRTALGSMLCLPITRPSHQGGVLYLENSLIRGAFTEDRTAMLELVAAQAAISLENADLYEEQKHMHLELQSLNTRLLDIIEFLPDATFVIDEDRRVIAWNRAMEEMTGIPKEAMLQKGDLAYSLPFYGTEQPMLIDRLEHYADLTQEQYDYVKMTGDMLWAEMFVPAINDGHGAYLMALASPLKDSTGRVVGAIESLRDITARKEVQEALRLSEERYRIIVENAGTAIIIIEENGAISLANNNFHTLFGYDEKDLAGNIQWLDLIHPDDIERLIWYRTHKLEQPDDIQGQLELRLLTRRGQAKNTLLTMAMIPGTTKSVCAITDITELREAEEARSSLQNLLHNMIDSMPSCLIGVDLQKRVTQWNAEAQHLTGLSRSETIGQLVTEVLPIISEGEDLIGRAMEERSVQKQGSRLYEKEDREIHIEITVYPLIDQDLEGAVIRIDDVTDKVKIQEMMIQTEKMMSIGGLAAGMAHEINNPLGGIVLGAENVIRRLDPAIARNRESADRVGLSLDKMNLYISDRQIFTMLHGIKESGERASRIVQNMLQFSRSSLGEKTMASLNGLVDRTIEIAQNDYDLKKNFDFRRVEIIKQYDHKLPLVLCSEMEIEQVLLNLLKNAAYAMQMARSAEYNPAIWVLTYCEENWAVMEIKDNGPGIDDKVKRHIFEPFFTTKPTGIGTGLGLSVSYFIITNNHQGQISVDSGPGAGACFTIKLPLPEKPAQERPETS